MSEEVIFHDDNERITVTRQRLIYGDKVTHISDIKFASIANSQGAKDYLVAIFLLFLGIVLVFTFSWWSLLGLFLLTCPYFVFFGRKRHFLIIGLHSDGAAEPDDSTARLFNKDFARSVSSAINSAIQSFRVSNDPRSGLDLNSFRQQPDAGEEDDDDGRSIEEIITEATELIPDDIREIIDASNWRESLSEIFSRRNVPEDARNDITNGVHLILLNVATSDLLEERLHDVHGFGKSQTDALISEIDARIFVPLAARLSSLED